MRHIISAALVLLAVTGAARAQKSPEETIKSMTVAIGLQVELFAAEPMLINPTSIDVDHRGRVWVCEAVNYRRKNFNRPILREEGDRIVILTDKDGDGKADDSTVFYQGKDLYGPLGVCVLAQPSKDAKGGFAYRVLVCQSPDILEFWDKDGDGKADGPPTKFLTNFGGFDHDHGVHGINVGPDGKLYFTVGDSGVRGLQAADGKGPKWTSNDKDVQKGTVWRCDQDGKNLELIAHNFRNNYECCVNSFGEIWLSDNDDDGNQQTRICHVMPGGNYGYGPRGPGQTHWHEEQPGIVHKTMRTGFGSPTGICFYEGTLLPKKYHGQLLHTDAGPRELRAFHIKPKGAGYELEKENLLTSTDNWFRLSDVCVAPDGSLLLADWYDPGVGGHGMGDWTRGRIYRITPYGHKGYKVPEVKLDTKEGVQAAIGSPNLAARWIAIFHLQLQSNKEALTTLLDGLKSNVEVLKARNHIQYVNRLLIVKNNADLPDGENKAFDKFLKAHADSPSFVSMFTRSIPIEFGHMPGRPGIFKDGKAIPGRISAAREALLAMRMVDADQVKAVFFQLAQLYDGQDIFYRAALNIACGTDPERRDKILADFDKHFPEWNDKVADLVWELRPKSVLPRLNKLLVDDKLSAAQKARIVDILAANDDPAAGKTMLTLLNGNASAEVKSRALDNLRLFLPTKWNALSNSPEMAKAIKDMLGDAKSRSTGLQLVAVAKHVASIPTVVALAKDTTAEQASRVEAIRTLGQVRSLDALNALIEVGQPENPLTIDCVKAIALQLPGSQKTDAIGQLALTSLQRAITSKKASFELKNSALSALAGSRSGTQWLLDAKEKNDLPEELVADAGRLLRNSPFQGERNRAMLLFPAAGKIDPKKLPPISELVKRTGDAKRGEQLLAASLKGETQCLRCHTVRGVGGNIGPDQSMIGKKASRENLFESILQPSKAIADQYVQWRIDTLDGKSITGLLVEESKKALVIRDANGKDHPIPVAEVDKRTKSLVSIMPDNLVSALSVDDLIDLVEYLLTLKSASYTPESWLVVGPLKAGAEKDPLETAFPPDEKGIDLATAKEVKRSDTGYIDLAALHGIAGQHSASYLYRAIESPVEQKVEFLLGTDDGFALFVNGKQVAKENLTRAASPGQSKVTVTFKAGKNDVLLKVANGNNPHGAYITLLSGEELKPTK